MSEKKLWWEFADLVGEEADLRPTLDEILEMLEYEDRLPEKWTKYEITSGGKRYWVYPHIDYRQIRWFLRDFVRVCKGFQQIYGENPKIGGICKDFVTEDGRQRYILATKEPDTEMVKVEVGPPANRITDSVRKQFKKFDEYPLHLRTFSLFKIFTTSLSESLKDPIRNTFNGHSSSPIVWVEPDHFPDLDTNPVVTKQSQWKEMVYDMFRRKEPVNQDILDLLEEYTKMKNAIENLVGFLE